MPSGGQNSLREPFPVCKRFVSLPGLPDYLGHSIVEPDGLVLETFSKSQDSIPIVQNGIKIGTMVPIYCLG